MEIQERVTPERRWDELLDASLRRANMPASAARSGKKKLMLRKEPIRHWLPQKPREIVQIDPQIRGIFRQLIAGELPWPLTLLGPAGTGKTCAGLCLVDAAGGWYYTVAELCDEFIQAQQRSIEITTRRLWDRIEQTVLVVIDELGSREKVSDHHYDVVKRLLDKRENMPAVFISNHSLEKLAAIYDDRLASRLAYGTILIVKGRDRRLANGG